MELPPVARDRKIDLREIMKAKRLFVASRRDKLLDQRGPDIAISAISLWEIAWLVETGSLAV